jgi:hypothetical protein
MCEEDMCVYQMPHAVQHSGHHVGRQAGRNLRHKLSTATLTFLGQPSLVRTSHSRDSSTLDKVFLLFTPTMYIIHCSTS